MSIEGSQIPAEARVDQIMGRINALVGTGQVNNEGQQYSNTTYPKQADFKAMAAMMQAQMMGEALTDSSDNNNSSNPLSGMMGGMNPMMGGMNPMMMGMMNPAMASMMMQNPQMMQMMMGGTNPSQGQEEIDFPAFNENELHNHFHGEEEHEHSHEHYGSDAKVIPVKGRISSAYGSRTHPVTGHSHFHSGVDIAAPLGAPIRMPWDGKVVFVGNVNGFGPNTVIVAHENKVQADGKIVYSVFGHNSKVLARTGDHLAAGEVVATVGSEGRSTGPHVHWETRVAAPGIQGKNIFNQQIAHTLNPMNIA
jgi:murein DD-endopeptidase MepM/ murein hydrolase activator NlpD